MTIGKVYLLSRAEILDAIYRANLEYPEPDFVATVKRGPHAMDGTYRIIPTWIGSARVWHAERINETEGYEIAYAPVINDGNHYSYPLDESRFGYWTNPATGEEFLDQTIHTRGNFAVALEIGALYSQLAIWDWSESRTWNVDANDEGYGPEPEIVTTEAGV